RMICEFEHHSPITVDLQIEVVRPARLAVQPPELDFGVISTMRQQKLLMTLVNGGGEELIVESLAPSVEWAHCLAQTPLRIGQGGTFLLDVQVQGSLELAGEHTGEIEIRSNSYQTPIQTIPFIVKFVSPTPYEDYIGIDFGTTASCIAVLDKNDHPLIIPLDAPEPTSQADPRIMPSVAFLQSDGTILTGYEALSAAAIEPANAVTSIKRALGQKHKEGLSGQGFDPTALTAKIINQLVIRTENALFSMGEYKTPRRAIITVPVEFFDNQRRALLKACEMAGLETHSSSDHGVVIDEAHAAALYYMSKKQQEETSGHERLLIFDFGGGTLDCALIQIEVADRKVLLKTLALGGDPQLGGVDIDWALVGLLADRAKSEFPEFDINCVGDQQKFGHLYHTPGITQPANITRAHFKQQAEQAKIALTKAPAFELTINRLLRIGATPLEPYLTNSQGTAHFNVTVMQEELSSIVEPFIQRASRVVETICQRANIALEDVHTILHTGRTSLLPLVRERINAMLPNAVDRSQLIEPKLCVALGAAFWGYIKDLPNAAFEFVGGANRLIHDIGYIDFNTGMLRQIFVPVFPAQTEFPCEEMIELPLSKNLVTLQLAENRGKNILTEDNTEIKKVGRVRIDASGTSGNILPVRFAIDENRVIEITANGQTQTIEMMDE
ncbi:MAG TPA: Hsp70 family protein, partial [Pyrinomonadaceae bacterium]|nr:Hsp70 family protein [Pyrinomonadaceae bacterium]